MQGKLEVSILNLEFLSREMDQVLTYQFLGLQVSQESQHFVSNVSVKVTNLLMSATAGWTAKERKK